MKTTRIIIRVRLDLLKKFDQKLRDAGFQQRSEAIRAIMRDFCEDRKEAQQK